MNMQNVNQIVQQILAAPHAQSTSRYLFGIAGPPAAGKSTLATELAKRINQIYGDEIAIVVPMDGFHLPNALLHQRNLYAEKGAPRTFDADGFVALLSEIKNSSANTIFAPAFDHNQSDPVSHAIAVKPQHRFVIVEGNYLLLSTPPWSKIKSILNAICYLQATPELTYERLFTRHHARGRSVSEIETKIRETDFVNHLLIAEHTHDADFMVDAQQMISSEMSMESYEFAGIGSSTLDVLVSTDISALTRINSSCQETLLQGGGPVATAMATIARLGGSTCMIDRIGDDYIGDIVLSEFKKFNVATQTIERTSGTTSVSTILINPMTGDRTILYKKGSAIELTAADIDLRLFSRTKAIHMNGRHPEACHVIVNFARANNILISFDGGAQSYSDVRRELALQSDLCIVAEDFAAKLTEMKDPQAACQTISRLGPRVAVVTCGRNGCWVSADSTLFHQPAFLTDNTIDTTGCGDSFHGGFLHAYVHGQPLKDCARFAAMIASLNSTALGGRGHLPTFDEVQSVLKA